MKSGPIRWGWLKFLYIYTVVGASSVGLAVLFAPQTLQTLFGLPDQNRFFFGMLGSLFAAIGLLATLGLESPLEYLPVLLVQFLYKSIWLLAVILPQAIAGPLPAYAGLLMIIFAVYIGICLYAVPFPYLLSRVANSDRR